MRNEYATPEFVEVGDAGEMILGAKHLPGSDLDVEGLAPDNELDD
jgi:hypothetical protein